VRHGTRDCRFDEERGSQVSRLSQVEIRRKMVYTDKGTEKASHY
jgi:hypothetical protein